MELYHFTKNLYLFFIPLIMVSFPGNVQKPGSSSHSYGIIPAPQSIGFTQNVSQIKTIKVYENDPLLHSFLRKMIDQIPGASLSTMAASNLDMKIIDTMSKEEYTLDIFHNTIHIRGGSSAAIQFAWISLKQLVINFQYPLPEMNIRDFPEYGYRGMHLDVCRHFFTVEEVKKYLDFMTFYKFNHFHWHLTEDQGWRIEIKKYPNLQKVGAYRKETLVGHSSDRPEVFDGVPYGGYYTQEEIKEVVAYATERNIVVIPEIEMPGHALAALASYPDLGCTGGSYEVATQWGVFDDVFCPYEETFTFLENVIDEVANLFPGPYIHIGGDECPKTSWRESAYCQNLIKSLKLKDEYELQSYFIRRIESYIQSKGKQIIGWDEILEGGLAPGATVMSWRGTEGGIEAAKSRQFAIMTPGSHCYFDHYQSEDPSEPLAIGGYTPIQKVYEWEPVPLELDDVFRKYILGGQGNVWTEYIKTFSQVEYMAYSRAMALAEALWSKTKDYVDFINRFEMHYNFWIMTGVNLAHHIYELKPEFSAGSGSPVSIRFSLPSQMKVVHSMGDEIKSISQDDPVFTLKDSGLHQFYVHLEEKKRKPLYIEFENHLGTEAIVELSPPPSKHYSGWGASSLVNGVKGRVDRFNDREWLGFSGSDPVVTMDFTTPRSIESIHLRFFQNENQWIYLPGSVAIYMSNDGVDFHPMGEFSLNNQEGNIGELEINFKVPPLRYLKVEAKHFGKIPIGAPGGGQNAWLFMDEIIVREVKATHRN
ncbi:MAG TPA: family 20 glycosylhydrolase [Saprospiraceae bacterium]|nr:family 20 glycosylhydrolase [Saprospiraceae bacterium]